MSKFIILKANAKINLSLYIVGKFLNNLHKIESIVSFIKLSDSIFVRKIKSKNHKVYFRGKFAKGISKKNTITNLLNLLEDRNLLNDKYEIKVIKNIPQESGMGGGSMNAACLINYFLKKKIIKIDKKEIINISKLIGFDVIFGIKPKTSIISSNGKLTKFNKKFNYHVLIAKPNFGCSTKLIYSKVKKFSKPKYNSPSELLLRNKNIVVSENKLETIAFKMYPKLKILKLYLSKLPNVIFVRMSGSGSTILAYFYSNKASNVARRELRKKFNTYWCITSKTI